MTDPTQRCVVRTVCPAPTLVGAPAAAQAQSSAGSAAPGLLFKVAAGLAAAAAAFAL